MMAKQSGRLMTTWPMPTVHSDSEIPNVLSTVRSPSAMIR